MRYLPGWVGRWWLQGWRGTTHLPWPAPATPQYHPRPARLQAQAHAGSHWPVPPKCRLKLQPVIRRLQWQLPSQSQSQVAVALPLAPHLHPKQLAALHTPLQIAAATRTRRDEAGTRRRHKRSSEHEVEARSMYTVPRYGIMHLGPRFYTSYSTRVHACH